MRQLIAVLLILVCAVTHAQKKHTLQIQNLDDRSVASLFATVKKTGKNSFKVRVRFEMPKGSTTHPCESCDINDWDDNTPQTKIDVGVMDSNWIATSGISKYKYKGKSIKYRRGSYQSRRMKVGKDKKDTMYIPYKVKTHEVICRVREIHMTRSFEIEESDEFKSKRLFMNLPLEEDETKGQKRRRERENRRIQKHIAPARPNAIEIEARYTENSIRKVARTIVFLPKYNK